MGKQIGNVNTENAFLVRPDPDLVNPRFLGYAIENSVNQGGLERKAKGSVQKFINRDDLNDLEIESLQTSLGNVASVSTARNVRQFKKGDILVSNRGTVGRTEFIDEDIEARRGFMGMVNKKTKFTVGEGNKKEFVSRKKVNVFDVNMFNKPRKNTNIFDMGGF